ncbi:MAG: 30S ribosomal protein S18 [Candidatus Omnitrophica bacterium]|nr:30S ribosomal protein S18 [Candidatus Omnitrophota bacterium]
MFPTSSHSTHRRAPSERGGPAGAGPRHASRQRVFIKKTCRLCAEKATSVDYKDFDKIRRFLTEKGKIIPRRITGNCAKCQRVLARAVKRSRHAGVVAFQID